MGRAHYATHARIFFAHVLPNSAEGFCTLVLSLLHEKIRLQTSPSYRPALTGYSPALTDYNPVLTGYSPAVTSYRPDVTGYSSVVTSYSPVTENSKVWKRCSQLIA